MHLKDFHFLQKSEFSAILISNKDFIIMKCAIHWLTFTYKAGSLQKVYKIAICDDEDTLVSELKENIQRYGTETDKEFCFFVYHDGNELLQKYNAEYDMIVLTPKMIALLIKKIRNSDKKELIIPAAEMLPQGYMEYLFHVLEANRKTKQTNIDSQAVCELIAGQLQMLCLDQQKCFDTVSLYERKHHIQFYLSANKTFYLLVKQQIAAIAYIYL